MRDLLNHCFPWAGQLLYPQGDTQFFNHSAEPSIRPAGDGETWLAARPIRKGDEIRDDYGTFDNGAVGWYEEACARYQTECAAAVARKYGSKYATYGLAEHSQSTNRKRLVKSV